MIVSLWFQLDIKIILFNDVLTKLTENISEAELKVKLLMTDKHKFNIDRSYSLLNIESISITVTNYAIIIAKLFFFIFLNNNCIYSYLFHCNST